jgi:hypothetical protein
MFHVEHSFHFMRTHPTAAGGVAEAVVPNGLPASVRRFAKRTAAQWRFTERTHLLDAADPPVEAHRRRGDTLCRGYRRGLCCYQTNRAGENARCCAVAHLNPTPARAATSR